MGNGQGIAAGVPGAGSTLTRKADVTLRSSWDESGSVVCGACHYANRVSQAFYALSVQHLYCRRCGRMIGRDGKPVSYA